MNGLLLLFLISGSVSKKWRSTDDVDDIARYCRICSDHTMCRFPYDEPGFNCAEVSSMDLDDVEIEWLLLRHNSLRQTVETPGDDAKMTWDDELARIARRWALQCNIYETDSCRDVGRFAVLQLVNAMELSDEADKRTMLQRLSFHVGTWEDILAPHGKTSTTTTTTSGSRVTTLGCARAIYSVDFGTVRPWVETLVCNYGPIKTDAQLRSRLQKELPQEKQEKQLNATASAAMTTTTSVWRRLLLVGYLFYVARSFIQDGFFVRNPFSRTWT